MYKIYMIVIGKRLQDVLEEHLCETQFGFRPSHSTSQAIFITRRLQDIAEQQGSNMVLTFLDWEKAFDRVQRWSFMDGSTPPRYSRWFYFCSKGLLLQGVIFRRRWVWMFKQEENFLESGKVVCVINVSSRPKCIFQLENYVTRYYQSKGCITLMVRSSLLQIQLQPTGYWQK